ncbi:hypothetical protein B566_EDAN016985 [Ephemera danica]|nr:hypothetical protein B566_EDAN016985 [Ephemera danica]
MEQSKRPKKAPGGTPRTNRILLSHSLSPLCREVVLSRTLCEVRSGPEYVLRSYSFSRNNTFRLLQFHYADASCTSPQWAVMARGKVRVRGRSWVTPGGAESDYSLHRVTTMSRQHRSHGADEEIDCADGVLPASFHELQLLRVQRRPAAAPDSRASRLELLSGDVHSRPEMRLSYRPTAYQPPLLRTDQIARASERSPPHLPARARLPVFLSGEWVSPRCEVRPLGMFVKRRLRFSQQRGRKWAGEFRYFSDSSCSIPTITTHAAGRFSTGRESAIVQAGTELEFRVDSAALAVHDDGIVNALNTVQNGRCGSRNQWDIDELQDVTPTGGCEALGVTVPIIERELLKIDMDRTGNSLLYLGQVDTERGGVDTGGDTVRPTAYQSPLVQCRSTEDVLILTHHIHRSMPPSVAMSNQLFPIPHARTAPNHVGKVMLTPWNLKSEL